MIITYTGTAGPDYKSIPVRARVSYHYGRIHQYSFRVRAHEFLLGTSFVHRIDYETKTNRLRVPTERFPRLGKRNGNITRQQQRTRRQTVVRIMQHDANRTAFHPAVRAGIVGKRWHGGGGERKVNEIEINRSK